jgi:hypothetical protein
VNHRTALTWAAEKGHTEVAKALIEAGADVNAKDKVRGRYLSVQDKILCQCCTMECTLIFTVATALDGECVPCTVPWSLGLPCHSVAVRRGEILYWKGDLAFLSNVVSHLFSGCNQLNSSSLALAHRRLAAGIIES